MTPEDLQNITYKRQRYRNQDKTKEEDLELEDLDLEDWVLDRTESGTQAEKDKGKRTMEDDDKVAFNSLISALNDLVKG